LRNITYLLFLSIMIAISCTSEKKADSGRDDSTDPVWPIFRGQRGLTGVAQGSLPDNLKLLWSFQTENDVKSSPVIAAGRVYCGSNDSRVFAIDFKTGSKIWEFNSGDDVEAPPLYLDEMIYVGNVNGSFFALDAATGKVKWQYETDGQIYGSANWARMADTADDYYIFVGNYDTYLYGFNSTTGSLLWSCETDNYINGAPATNGTITIFGGCDEKLHIVEVASGKKQGEVNTGSYIAGSAALKEDKAYLGHYGGKLICIDIESQKIIWEYGDAEKGAAFFSSPAVGDEVVLIGARDKQLHCVEKNTGSGLWRFITHDDIDASPVICDDKVVVASRDGRIYLVNLKDGSMAWSYEIGAAISGSPAVAGGKIVIGAEDGRIYCFGE
jgi:outer membrane protein assembly factor BamB